MIRSLGRGLQIFALTILPIAVILELTGGLSRSFGLADMVKMLLLGVVAFVLGRLLEGYATSKAA